jgi:hypothetical protein
MKDVSESLTCWISVGNSLLMVNFDVWLFLLPGSCTHFVDCAFSCKLQSTSYSLRVRAPGKFVMVPAQDQIHLES